MKKSAKKFARKGHLKSAIQNRKKFQKNNRFKAERAERSANGAAAAAEKAEKNQKRLEEMDLDEFLDGGFEEAAVDVSGSEDEGEADGSDGEMNGSESEEEDLGSEEEPGEGEEEGADEDQEGEEEEDDDDEEEEAAAVGGKPDPVVQDNKRLKGEVSKHKSQLEALRQKDPEFFAYLQQTDSELLSFGAGEDEEEDEEDESEEESEEEDGAAGGKASKKAVAEKKQKKKKGQDAAGEEGEEEGGEGEEEEEGSEEEEEEGEAGPSGREPITVTSALVAKWCAAARTNASLYAMQQLCKAYRLACHYGDSEDAEAAAASMRMASGAVYNAVMMFMLREADGIFRRMLGLDKRAEDKPLAADDVTRSNRWRKVGPLLRSYLGNSLHALGVMTDAPLLAFGLRRVRASVPLMTPAPLARTADKFLKTCLSVFGGSEAAAPRLQAFLGIRQLALCMPHPYIEKCLKGVYRVYLANTKFVSASNAPHIAFMTTCAVELWGLDVQASYAHAFAAIRQLAVSMRAALNSKSGDAYKEIYSWQGVCALELWARVLGAHADKAELRPLAYPLVQVLLGAARLVPTPRFFPLRLRVLRAAHRLAAAHRTFAPLAAPMLDLLHWAALNKAPKGAAGSSPDLSLTLRAGKNALRSPGFQEEVVTQVLELLAGHLAQWSTSPAFPELSHLAVLHLRKFAKTTKIDRFRKAAKSLLDAIERNVVWVGAARDSADFAPRDVNRVAAFLAAEYDAGKAPLQQYAAQLATKAAARAALRSADEVDVGGKGGKGRKRGRGDEDDEEEDEEEEAAGSSEEGEGEEDEGGDEEGEDSGTDEEDVAHLAGKKGAKARAPLDLGLAMDGAGGEDGGDLVGSYQLSDDDEEEEGGSARGRKGAKAPVAAAKGKGKAQQLSDDDGSEEDEEGDEEGEEEDEGEEGEEEDGMEEDEGEEGDEEEEDDAEEGNTEDFEGPGSGDLDSEEGLFQDGGEEEEGQEGEEGDGDEDGPPPAKQARFDGGGRGRGSADRGRGGSFGGRGGSFGGRGRSSYGDREERGGRGGRGGAFSGRGRSSFGGRGGDGGGRGGYGGGRGGGRDGGGRGGSFSGRGRSSFGGRGGEDGGRGRGRSSFTDRDGGSYGGGGRGGGAGRGGSPGGRFGGRGGGRDGGGGRGGSFGGRGGSFGGRGRSSFGGRDGGGRGGSPGGRGGSFGGRGGRGGSSSFGGRGDSPGGRFGGGRGGGRGGDREGGDRGGSFGGRGGRGGSFGGRGGGRDGGRGGFGGRGRGRGRF